MCCSVAPAHFVVCGTIAAGGAVWPAEAKKALPAISQNSNGGGGAEWWWSKSTDGGGQQGKEKCGDGWPEEGAEAEEKMETDEDGDEGGGYAFTEEDNIVSSGRIFVDQI